MAGDKLIHDVCLLVHCYLYIASSSVSSTTTAMALNSSSKSSLCFIIINHKIPAHVGVTVSLIKNDAGH